jgi:Tfp pilus assembly protein PilN
MRPVNLLPLRYRPRQATGALGGSAYVVVAVLGVLLLGVVVYVLTANQVSSRKADIATAKAEEQQARARAAELSQYASFKTIAQTRLSSVAQLAAGRLDWERLMRETSRVLPAGVWLTGLDASTSGQTGPAGGQPSPAGSAAPAGPAAELNGCAPNQRAVATTLVRLRALHGADDVQLKDSAKALPTGASPSSGGTSSAAGANDCGNRYAFDVSITLTPPAQQPLAGEARKVPASLGGGA